jgi:hypothetical protein
MAIMTSAGVNATGFCLLGKTREVHAGLAMIATGAFSGGTDSTQITSEDRDAR